ncbi:MAG TPA: Lpg1974 family pore-forming outer membrane protein [Chlamydiales bacterium]|nr:Lpg1974 family pore-forming outer membrane protein [Chlamydiales bacterium]
MVASLLVAASGFGQQQDKGCCPTPKPKPQCCEPVKCEKVCPPVCCVTLVPAYNQSAAIDTRCSWDVWVDGSFTYWQALQDNMEIGIADSETAAQLSANTTVDGHIINTNFKYKPGFKVGAGMKFDYDDWDAYAGYTWFRSSVHTSSNGPANGTSPVTFGMILPMVGKPRTIGTAVYDTVSSRWKCNMDFVDAIMGRWYYVGRKLTFHPYAGARGAWIRQKFNTTYTVVDPLFATNQSTTVGDSDVTHQQSHSWAVGPKMGIDINWMLGEGLRLYSCGSGDILFTRYNKSSTKEVHTVGTTITTTEISQKKINTVRTHLDMEMGLGWGTYLDCNNWYLDLSAGYGFQVFFDQNMFRNFEDDLMRGKSLMPNGNLYVHGMTATVALHF